MAERPGQAAAPDADLQAGLAAIVGAAHVVADEAARAMYETDALERRVAPAIAVVRPGSTTEVAAVLRLCSERRLPVVPRGAGTGYSGGAVPAVPAVVLSLERLNRILEIDEANLLAVVEPHVITADLNTAAERVGLHYPPDPASLDKSTIGGNLAECAGGPRAFKYGTTRRYVLGLEAVLASGEIVHTGGRTVKNVVGYDLTQLLVGSEGTLAVITKATLRLVPRPPARQSVKASFASVAAAAEAVIEMVRARVVPAAVELIDRESLEAVARYTGSEALASAGAEAVLLIDVDGLPAAVAEEVPRVVEACRRAGAREIVVAATGTERDELWRVRRELSFALRAIAPMKINHDVVVPKGRVPELVALIARLRERYRLTVPCFGHAGDGNIHVNIMVDPADPDALARARAAEGELFPGVVALGGSISGEHGIGLTKAPYLGVELDEATIALMRRVKQAFDPLGILNPGKIFSSQ